MRGVLREVPTGWRALAVCLGLSVVLTNWGLTQPLGVEEEETVLPRRAPTLAPGRDVEGRLTARTPQAWYRIDVPKTGDVRSLRVTMSLPGGATFDADLAVFDAEGMQLAAAEGVCAEERCLIPIEGLARVFVRVELYAPEDVEGQTEGCPFTLRAELSSRQAVAGLPVYADGLSSLQPGSPVSGELPTDDEDSPTACWHTLELPETGANVARLKLTTGDPKQAALGFGVCQAGGNVLTQSAGSGDVQSLCLPLEGVSGPAYVAVWLNSREPEGATDYTLAVEFTEEESGPEIIVRRTAAGPKSFTNGQRVFGQVVDPAEPFCAWLLNASYGSSQLFVCPDRRETGLRVVIRDQMGWAVREQTVGGDRLTPIPVPDGRMLLVEVGSDRPCGFGMLAVEAREGPTFDPATAQPLAAGAPVTGKLEGGGTAVYRIEAPPAPTVPRVSLAADPLYADLDLSVCAGPGVLLWSSAKPGGSEGVAVLAPGAAPLYIVVTAAKGAAAAYDLTVEETPAAFAPVAGMDTTDYLLSYYAQYAASAAGDVEVDDPLADELGPPEPFGGG
jgi:hypothetical protein